jgi:large exoprotein involved in heme utilization and adhesion
VPIAEQAELFTGFFTLAGSSGKAGDVTIETGRLTLTDAAQVSATTVGEGQGGTLRVTASEAVELIGIGSGLTTETLGSGNAGNLIIETEKLIIRDGGYVSASTIGEGQAGTLSVTASDAVEVAGTPDGQIPSGLSAISASPKKAGNLTITTGDLIIRDRGQVSVSSTTSAGGGSLEVTASSIQLDNQSVLAAQSGSGDGGNITLQVQDLLLLRRNSEISTEAGMNQAGGNGGNITIDTDFIVAVPKEDSDIVADAFEGNGVISVSLLKVSLASSSENKIHRKVTSLLVLSLE